MGQGRKWTKEEEDYLQENWGQVSVRWMAQKLNRSETAIIVRKERLHLGAFMESGDYITFNQLLKTIGHTGGIGYLDKLWIKDRGLPVRKQRVRNNTFHVIRIDEFWKWAEKNQRLLDFSRFEENALGMEPEWVKEKRRRDYKKSRMVTTSPWTSGEDAKLERLLKQQKYTYKELSQIMQRTNGAIKKRICNLHLKDRPLKEDNHTRWTEEQFQELGELIKAGWDYSSMAVHFGKSEKSLRGRIYQMYLTENLDKARETIGTGMWGDNRSERTIGQWNTMNTEERIQVRDLLTRLTAIMKYEFRQQLESTEWGYFFQKDMCANFSGKCLKTSGCDECLDYKKMDPQNCKRCGKTFYERHTNNFCCACRNMRKKQWLRKKAAGYA